MYKAIVYKDVCTLRQKRLFFIWQVLVVIGAVALIKISSLGNGVDLFGEEFIHLFIISIASLGAFLELYMNFLLDDARDNIMPMLSFNKAPLLPYWLARVTIPLAAAAISGFAALGAYALFIDQNAIASGFLPIAAAAMLAEIVLATGLGMIAAQFFNIDVATNPNIALPLIGANALLLYIFNPARHGVLPFMVAAIAVGIACLIVSARILKSRYRGNIRDAPAA